MAEQDSNLHETLTRGRYSVGKYGSVELFNFVISFETSVALSTVPHRSLESFCWGALACVNYLSAGAANRMSGSMRDYPINFTALPIFKLRDHYSNKLPCEQKAVSLYIQVVRGQLLFSETGDKVEIFL